MSHCVKKTSLDVGWELADEAWLLPNGQPRKLGYTQLEWLPAQVPGYVHLDLCRHGVIVDPFEGLGELGCQWIDEATWIYRLRFHASMTPNLPKRVLRFNGVDTVCTVFLNDQALARHDNMFQALELDVSEHLRPGINEVMLRFESAPAVGRARRLSFFGREGLPDNVARFPERAFLRKAQYMFSWDWGPRLCSAGIWQPVHLLEFRSRLIDVWVKQHPLASGAFELSCHAEVEGEGDVYHRINGCWLADGQTHEILHPRLWWPTGLGSQELYTVESVLLPTGHTPGNNPSVLDQRHQRIGLRTISLERNPDTRGETFAFQVNGQALWAVGANWIPDHSFPSLVDRPRLRKQLERALDMNMNMIRIWGGGLYESDAFYELCDEMGLLVWQDFPFACSYVPDDPADQTALRSEATENIRRLRNHPCLALWCGNNENLTMWDSKWDEPLPQPGRYYGEHHYNEVLPAVLSEEDPTRPYIPSSPIGGNNANDGDVGDQHYWDVWHGRGDWVHYQDSTARFASEFGFAAAPGRSAWRKILAGHPDPFALDVRDRRARFHDKTDKGYETYLNYIERHYPAPKNLDELTYYSQLNQRDALRFGIEHYRRSDFCRGSLIWQLNDCWPVQSWAVVDSEGQYKAAAFELRRLHAHTLVSLYRRDQSDPIEAWAILDNHNQSVTDEFVVEARSLVDGSLIQSWADTIEVQPGERRCIFRIDTSGLPARQTLLTAHFGSSCTHRLLCEPKELQVLTPNLSVAVHPQGILLHSDRPIVDLWLWDDTEELWLLDNFVTLATPGSIVLRAQGRLRELSARSLGGRHPVRV